MGYFWSKITQLLSVDSATGVMLFRHKAGALNINFVSKVSVGVLVGLRKLWVDRYLDSIL